MPDPAARPVRRYAAFLSYRHADNREEGRRWAEWLHQSLETYEVPRDLVGKPNLRGTPVPGALYPVFRDEEELPADADLSQNIRRALENSDLLIVLCSPRACQSRFVAEEIRYFKELGKSDRILALMIDGEPNADDPAKAAQGVTAAMECFPEPLRFGVPVAGATPPGAAALIDWAQRTEPIAADVRPGNTWGQGYTSAAAFRAAFERAGGFSSVELLRLERAYSSQLELARLKLAAGLLGVSLGQLRERDAAYRLKKLLRLTAVLGGFALAALAAAGVANWQRGVANKQRVIAEAKEKDALDAGEHALSANRLANELIAYLQYDLHGKLTGIGRQDLAEEISERIRLYHEELEAWDIWDPLGIHGQDPKTFEPRASGFDLADATHKGSLFAERRGDTSVFRGDLAGALRDYRIALRLLRELSAREPANAYRQRDLSIVLQRIGQVEMTRGELPAALRDYQESLAITRRLAAENTGRDDWQRNDYEPGLSTALLLSSKRDARDAGAGWQRRLAAGLEKVGAVQAAQQDWPSALGSYGESLTIRQELAGHNLENDAIRYELAAAYDHVADAQAGQGNLTAALLGCRESLAVRQTLARLSENSGLAHWRLDLADGERRLGLLLVRSQQKEEGRQHLKRCLELVDQLAAERPANHLVQVRRASARRDLADCADPSSPAGHEEALRLLNEAADILRGLEKPPGLEPEYAGWLREVETKLGELRQTSPHP